MKKFLIAATMLISASTTFADTYWVPANRSQCSTVCRTQDMEAVRGGSSVGGQYFHVCKGVSNVNNDTRPGFQLPGFNPTSCEISVGGTRQSLVYSCLCTDGQQREIFD